MALILRLVSGSSAKRPEPSGINAMPRVQRILTGQPWAVRRHERVGEPRNPQLNRGEINVRFQYRHYQARHRLLHDPRLNKSTGVTEPERQALGLVELVPDVTASIQSQLSRVLRTSLACQSKSDAHASTTCLDPRTSGVRFLCRAQPVKARTAC